MEGAAPCIVSTLWLYDCAMYTYAVAVYRRYAITGARSNYSVSLRRASLTLAWCACHQGGSMGGGAPFAWGGWVVGRGAHRMEDLAVATPNRRCWHHGGHCDNRYNSH